MHIFRGSLALTAARVTTTPWSLYNSTQSLSAVPASAAFTSVLQRRAVPPAGGGEGTSRSTLRQYAEYALPLFVIPVQQGVVSKRLGCRASSSKVYRTSRTPSARSARGSPTFFSSALNARYAASPFVSGARGRTRFAASTARSTQR